MNRCFSSIVALLLVGCVSSQPIEIRWHGGPNLPQPLGGHVAALLPEGVTVAGGSNWISGAKTWRDEIYALDANGSTWNQRAKLPAGMTLPATVVNDVELLFLGGWLKEGTTAETFAYASGQVQRSILPALPQGRAQASAANIHGMFYVIGGLTDGGDFNTAMTSVIRLTPGAKSWTEVATLPKPTGLASAVEMNNRIYLFGGMGPVGSKLEDYDQAICYDPSQNRWLNLKPLPFARRGMGVAQLDEHYILLTGGCRNIDNVPQMLDDVLVYDTRADSYHACDKLPYSALCEQAVLKGNKIYVIGGEDLPKHRTDRVVVGEIIRHSP